MAATSKKKAKAKKKASKRTASKRTASKKKVTKKKTKKSVAKKTAARKKIAKKTAAKKKTVKKKTKKKVAKKTTKKPVKKKKATKKASSKRKKTTGAVRASVEMLAPGVKPYKPKRGEAYMSKAQLQHFQDLLKGWRQQLLDDISRTIHAMQDDTINHPDPNDRATQETDMSLELRSRDRERKLIKKIDDTLLLIESGDYGFCENCGVDIGIERLEARPTATLCIDCKTLDEIRERQMM